jgi:hypothetical protein
MINSFLLLALILFVVFPTMVTYSSLIKDRHASLSKKIKEFEKVKYLKSQMISTMSSHFILQFRFLKQKMNTSLCNAYFVGTCVSYTLHSFSGEGNTCRAIIGITIE